MENLNIIIANNLIYLRKKASLTQLEFGEKVNYSDKTVSKWELGAVIPSVETLKEIADFYGVSLDYLVTEHQSQKDYAAYVGKTINAKNKMALISLAVSVIWCIAAVIYVAGYLKLSTIDPTINTYWTAFVWAIPASFLLIAYYTRKYFKGSKWIYFHLSAFVWTILLASYVQFLDIDNYWFLFIIGIPIQAGIIFFANIKTKN